ncbi:MAG: 3-deoxy-D-manno-octulosonic acid transferase [Desulfobacteraceae bacterium]|nr:MAG: 3-deoxy-D-manno-octulosonic acid transferase [Desulfobacteraceae bacterium]
MTKNAFILNFLKLYNILWRGALPFLKKSKRLAQGFKQRVSCSHLSSADLWIQAASAGEALLAVKIIQSLDPPHPIRVLITTTTRQGYDLLTQELGDVPPLAHIHFQLSWFPFDQPDIIDAYIKKVSPRVVVLLETEIWPAFLYYLKKNGIKTLIVNARLTRKSFKGYYRTRWIWHALTCDTILATSELDAARYRKLFPNARVDVMPNIKFDTLSTNTTNSKQYHGRDLDMFIDTKAPLTIFASIRKEEEPQVLWMLEHLLKEFPTQTVALFPRHMHRLAAWQEHLSGTSLPWQLKSEIKTHQVSFKIILWDTFGELNRAYEMADCAFVGGSLSPLGGQNFIEPIIKGVPTVTGPFLEDFKWVKPDIFQLGTVHKAENKEQAVDRMLDILQERSPRSRIRERAVAYIEKNRGGTRYACTKIIDALF